ncbi:glycosyl transferase [Rhodopseudomonas palustris]|uniref:Glycosyl transferase n=1 Tax=Rhodopseudomonas palustris TaxID=1076 RepID=A0A323U941_RHOPL|nr:glycosyltransferase family 4 protein [Rhodopseudomonas palustris]PZA09342.1 glycosyl transferase [Rhodopseudomonas palustris]
MTGSGVVLLLAISSAAVGCALLTWTLMPLLARYALARPNARSSHKTPTPQGAGIAVIAATLAVTAIAFASSAPALLELLPLFAAAIAIGIVGAVDDIRPISVLPRFALQALCVGVVVVCLPADQQIVPALPLWLERTALGIAGLWFVNLVNFMDGLDWMTVAEGVPVTLTLAVFGLFGAVSPSPMLLAAALGGALIGFAPFNRPGSAKVFLGDVGSLPIGLLLGWCLLQLALQGHVAAAFLLPLYYLADSTLTLLRRMLQRERFWLAHRSHFYQRATDNGFSVREVVRLVCLTNLALAVLAGASIALESIAADGVLIAMGGALVAALLMRFAHRKA